MLTASLIAVHWVRSSSQLSPVGAMHPIAVYRFGSEVLLLGMLAVMVAMMFLLRTRGARAHRMRRWLGGAPGRLIASGTFLLVMLALSVFAGGCANVGQQLKAEREGFNATLIAIHAGHVVGALPAADEAKMLPDLKVAQAALDAGDAAYKAGDKSTAGVYAKAAAAAIQKVQQLYGPVPTTPVKAAATQPVARPSSFRGRDRAPAMRASWYRVIRPPLHSDVTPSDDLPNALMFYPMLMAV